MSASPRSTAISARPRISRSSSAASPPTAIEASDDLTQQSRPTSGLDAAHDARARLAAGAARRSGARRPGPTRPSAASSSATGASSAAAGPSPAAGRMPRPRRWRGPARRRAAPPPMSRSSPAATTARPPPCAEALIAAGVARVVVAGRGPRPARRRRRASPGCATPASRSRPGSARDEAAELNAGFFLPHRARPAAGDAETGDLARRPHRHRTGREPLDHRRAGARAGASAARARMTRCWSAPARRSPTTRS